MPQPVENLVQGNNSTLMLTATPRHGAHAITFQFSDYSFQEFQDFCDAMNPKAIRITTAKHGTEMRIQFFLDKKKAYFGRGSSFAKAFRELITSMHTPTAVA